MLKEPATRRNDDPRPISGDQKLPEGLVIAGHWQGEFFALQVRGKTIRQWRGTADGFHHNICEFCGMGCRQHQALRGFGMLALVRFPTAHAYGRVWIGDVAKAIVEYL